MPRTTHSKRNTWITVLVLVVLLAATGVILNKYDKPLWTRWVAQGQAVVDRPINAVKSFVDSAKSIVELQNENKLLKSQLSDYASMKTNINELTQENQQLAQDKNLLGSQKVIAANVVGRDPSTWNSEITLDVGSDDGIKQDMVVILADKSLVGRISTVNAKTSVVMLVSNSKEGTSAIVQTNNNSTPAIGVVSGLPSNQTMQQNPDLQMPLIPMGSNFKIGDPVFTSGLSTIFPKGLKVGTVTKIATDSLGLTKTAVLKPSANLKFLQIVYVLK